MSAAAPARPGVGEPRPWAFPRVEQHRLSSGLRVLCCHLPGKPVVTVEVLADLPVEADPLELAGLAVLTARCLDEGTRSRDGDAFAAALERHGATVHAGAGYEGLTAAVDVPASRLADALPLLAEAVVEPAFAAADVERVRAQRLDQVAQERANPSSRAALELLRAMYAPATRWSLPQAGTAETVARVTAADVAAAYRRVGPATTVVVVAGDLAGVDPFALVEQAFTGWGGGDAPSAPAAPQVRAGARVLVVDRPDAVQTQLLAAHPLPDRRSPDWPSLVVGAYVLGGTLTSRLDALLREQKGVTYGIRASAQPSRRGGALVVSGAVEADSTRESVLDVARILTEAVEGGVRPDEVAPASRYLAGVSPLRWETPSAVAGQVATVVGSDLGPEWIDAYLEALRSATAEATSSALARHVDPAGLVVVAVGPADPVRAAAERLGVAEVEVVPA